MSKMKYTQGPWFADQDRNGNPTVTDNEYAIACLYNNRFNNEANARLMAVAPELFEFCNMILHGIAEEGHFDIKAGTPADQILRELIVKATTGSKT